MDFMNIPMIRLDTKWQPLSSTIGRVLVSDVFDVTSHDKYRPVNEKQNNTPYTYFIKMGDLIVHPSTRDCSQVGFATKKEAEDHRANFIIDSITSGCVFEDHVFLVLRNSDSCEGRGPMVYDSVWERADLAYEYIKTQPGFSRGPILQSVSYGCNISKNTYAHVSFGSGEYSMVAMPIKKTLTDKTPNWRF